MTSRPLLLAGLLLLALAPLRVAAAEAAHRTILVEDVVGDGVHDDTAAIQRAIDAAAHQGGGEVVLPRGRFRIAARAGVKSALRIANGGIALVGAGAGASRLCNASADGDTVLIEGATPDDYLQHASLSGLAFEPLAARSGAEIRAWYVRYLKVDDVHFEAADAARPLGTCLDLGNARRVSEFGWFSRLYAQGFTLFTRIRNYNDTWFSGISAWAGPQAPKSVRGVVVDGGVESMNWMNTDLIGRDDGDGDGFTIVADEVKASSPTGYNQMTGIYLDSFRNGLVAQGGHPRVWAWTGCWFSDRGVKHDGAGVVLGGDAEQFRFVNCQFVNCGAQGIVLGGLGGHAVVDGVVDDCNRGGSADPRVGSGIIVASPGCRVAGNRGQDRLVGSDGRTLFGVYIPSAQPRTIVVENDFTGLASAIGGDGMTGERTIIRDNF